MSLGLVVMGCSGGSRTSVPTPTVPLTTTEPPTGPAPTVGPTTTSCHGADVSQWTLAQKAAQLIVIPALNGQFAGLAPVIRQGVGGVILLGNKTPADLAAEIKTAGVAATAPLFVMADQEGGAVQRLAGLVPTLPSPRQMAQTMTPAQVQAAAQRVGTAMKALGVNVDLAPVVDVDGGTGPNARNPDGTRSFSADPALAAKYGVAFMQGLISGGVLPVVKHFPGLGGATANTDYGAANTEPWVTLQTDALPPFTAAVAARVPAVMVSNAIVPGLSSAPASLSASVIKTVLRGQLAFNGLVITDGLSANAILEAGYTLTTAAVAALKAGADMVLYGSTLTPAETELLSPPNVAVTTGQVIRAITAAVQAGDLSSLRLDDAVGHVLTAKGIPLC